MMERLGDVATYINGFAFKPTDWSDEGLQIIRIQDLTGNSYKTNFFNGAYLPKYEVNDGDVLISWSASLGVYVWKGEKAVLNQHIFKVVFDKCEVDKSFFVHQVQNILENAADEAHGATMKHLTKPIFDALPFYLPNMEIQREIASVLDEVNNLIALRNDQLVKLDELVKSRFIELFGLPVSNSKGWNTEKMREVAPAVNYSGDFEDAVWLLNLDMVEAQTGRILNYLYVNEEEVGNSTCTFDTTNVLYSKLRPYLNKVVIPDRCGYATSELIPLKPNPMKLERIYLAFMLRSDEFVNMINEKVAGAKMPRVSMSDFREFDVPVPPMELQKRFAAFVEQTDKSILAIQESLAELETLKKALMQKYFG